MVLDQERRKRILESKGITDKRRDLKLGWDRFWLAVIILFLLAIAAWYFFFIPREADWSVSPEGRLNYSLDRGNVIYSEDNMGGEKDRLIKFTYESRGTTVYGILRIPLGEEKVPGIILLPGAGVSKENEQRFASVLADMGYATLTIDQRGEGESKEKVGDFDTNYNMFRWGTEPQLHKSIYDVLRAYDLMKERPEIDPGRIIFMGESMGGRNAIIAAYLEPGAAGAVGISTSGYGFSEVVPRDNKTLFWRSIDPDVYIGEISPRKVLMLHSTGDTVIPIVSAERTFSYANEPKRFVRVKCETHGYCDEMGDGLEQGLAWMLEKE